MRYLFPVLVLWIESPSCKIGQETLQRPHFEQPGFSLGGGFFDPPLLSPQTVLFKFLGCFQPTCIFSPMALACSFFTKYFLPSLIHWLIDGLAELWVKIILTLSSCFDVFLLDKISFLVLFFACKIFFSIRVFG